MSDSEWIARFLLTVSAETERRGLLAVSRKLAEASAIANTEIPGGVDPAVLYRLREINECVIPYSEFEARKRARGPRRAN